MKLFFALAASLSCTALVVSGAVLDWEDCYCPIQVNDGACHYTLDTAIKAAVDGDVINLFDDIYVYDEIQFKTSLTFLGHGNPGPNMTASMNLPVGGMLRVVGENQKIHLENINFNRVGEGFGSALRSAFAGYGAYPTNPLPANGSLNLTIHDCSFKNFHTMDRGGAAIFIGIATYLDISSSEFSDNINHNYTPLRWEGGGSLWVQATEGHVRIKNTKFLRNWSRFRHGQGGGFLINWLAKGMYMEGVYMEENHAPGGGAVFLGTLYKNSRTTVKNCTFINNNATELGWGSRGGAMWIEYIHGKLFVNNSTFIGNHAGRDRGGAFANNKILGHGLVSLHGIFRNNYCEHGGSIWDSLSPRNDASIGKPFPAMRGGAEIQILAGTYMVGNYVKRLSQRNNIIYVNQSSLRGIVQVTFDDYHNDQTYTLTNNLNNAPN